MKMSLWRLVFVALMLVDVANSRFITDDNEKKTCIVTNSIDELHQPKNFCGDVLVAALRCCTMYYTPTDQHLRRKRERRRGVVDECCYRRCSLDYLLSNYCASYNRDVVLKSFDKSSVKQDEMDNK